MGTKNALSKSELTGLIDRDLAHWLAKHAGPDGALVLAPPNETATLYYYGSLRGLGMLARENPDGIGAAMRIVNASTPDEAKELIDRRGITHLVIPSRPSCPAVGPARRPRGRSRKSEAAEPFP